jgi:molybdopterin synthase catalytic subunit
VAAIAAEAVQKFGLSGCTVIHRVGRLLPGQNIVFVAAGAAHRAAALQAVAFLIDYLKTNAPFWKCESFESGAREWVAARAEDARAAADWAAKPP